MLKTKANDFHNCESGQISFLIVFSLFLLVALVALVFNTGDQITAKMQMQNAADAAAISGATWMARGMNVVSMCNVTKTQTLAWIVILKATITTAKRSQRRIIAALTVATPLAVPYPAVGWYVGILKFRLDVVNGILKLEPTIDKFTRPHNGILWKLMKSLDKFSAFTQISFPVAAQYEAYSTARLNGADWAVLFAQFSIGPVTSTKSGPILPIAKFPLKKVSLKALRDPTLNGSNYDRLALTQRRGYTPLLDYQPNVGPLKKFRKPFALLFTAIDGELQLLQGAIDVVFSVLTASPPSIDLTKNDYDRQTESILKRVTNSGRKDLPGPYVLEGLAASSQAHIQKFSNGRLTYLSIAQRDKDIGWKVSRIFENPNSIGLVTYAQSKVYNPTAWDMYTQDWRVKLVRTTLLETALYKIPGMKETLSRDAIRLLNTH